MQLYGIVWLHFYEISCFKIKIKLDLLSFMECPKWHTNKINFRMCELWYFKVVLIIYAAQILRFNITFYILNLLLNYFKLVTLKFRSTSRYCYNAPFSSPCRRLQLLWKTYFENCISKWIQTMYYISLATSLPKKKHSQ